MLEELRLNPRALAWRTRGRRQGADAGAVGVAGNPSLSTGFAESRRMASTGTHTRIHRLDETTNKEGVA